MDEKITSTEILKLIECPNVSVQRGNFGTDNWAINLGNYTGWHYGVTLRIAAENAIRAERRAKKAGAKENRP